MQLEIFHSQSCLFKGQHIEFVWTRCVSVRFEVPTLKYCVLSLFEYSFLYPLMSSFVSLLLVSFPDIQMPHQRSLHPWTMSASSAGRIWTQPVRSSRVITSSTRVAWGLGSRDNRPVLLAEWMYWERLSDRRNSRKPHNNSNSLTTCHSQVKVIANFCVLNLTELGLWWGKLHFEA